MKSQINLLSDEFTPHFELVSLSHLLIFSVLSIFLCGGVYAAVSYQKLSTETEISATNLLLSERQQTIDAMTTELSAKSNDPLLEARLASLKQLTATKASLLANLEDLSGLQQGSFSTMFDSLAQAQSNALWLTEFTVSSGELTIGGELSTPSALPIWIQQLQNTDFFKGQSFNVANVSRNNDTLSFELMSKPATEGVQASNGDVDDAMATTVGDDNGE
ncbi:MAG: PilN domain-containing protein [Glaciecola sp.]